jgi:hypothetical protein
VFTPLLQLLLGDKLEVPLSSSGGPFSGTTAAGVAVAADVLLMATGITTNSSLMAKQLPDALDGHGRIKVGCALFSVVLARRAADASCWVASGVL